MTTRRPRWHPPPPPTPKIIHLPRRIRRAKTAKPDEQDGRVRRQGKLGSLFDQERAVSRCGVPVVLLSSSSCDSARQERDQDGDGEDGRRGSWGGNEEEKWRFQAEFLRAECHFLRMEREIALKKLERNRARTEKAMKSAVQSLILGRDKVVEGENSRLLLEKEIEELEEKLEELQRKSPGGGGRDCEARKCCNFDKKASVLRRRMEKLGPSEEELDEEKRSVKEIRELAEASLAAVEKPRLGSDRKSRLADVETIRRKMEGLSKGMLERMEEYGGLLGGTTTATATVVAASGSAATSIKTEFPETKIRPQERWCGEDKGVCSGRCKSIVKKIVDQVRAETEQWSQLQAMLGQVREEMVELQASRDSWQQRALESHSRLQSTRSDMQEWKQRAKCAEARALELEKQISDLHTELRRLRSQLKNEEKMLDNESAWGLAKMEGSDEALDSQKEKEKHVLICRLKENLSAQKGKENKETAVRRSRVSTSGDMFLRQPLREVGNSASPLSRKGRAVLSLLHPEPSCLETI